MTVKISLRTAPPDTLPVTGVTVSHDNEADLSLIKLATLKATDIVVICGTVHDIFFCAQSVFIEGSYQELVSR